MKLKRTKLGFTLIELMVVITIIGILATGATSVYTSQIQKARDSNRVVDIKALQTSVEQLYADLSEYPSTQSSSGATTVSDCKAGDGNNDIGCIVVLDFMTSLPKDKKSKASGAGSPLDYTYSVADDTNGVNNQVYQLTIGFEAKGSVASKASTDDGTDDNRMEFGNGKGTISFASGSVSSGLFESVEGDVSCGELLISNNNDKTVVIAGDCGEGY